MVHETCYFASNYEEEIRSMGDPATMAAHTTVVQFPYTEAVSSFANSRGRRADVIRWWSRDQRQRSAQLRRSGHSTERDYRICKPRLELKRWVQKTRAVLIVACRQNGGIGGIQDPGI